MNFSGRVFGCNQASCSGLSAEKQSAVWMASQPNRSTFQFRSNSRCHRHSQNSRSSRHIVFAGEPWNPPTVADTKRRFYENYSQPIPAVYNQVIQEFLVAQHLVRYNKKYQYDEVFALGFISIFDQVLEGAQQVNETILNAYIASLDEDGKKYRSDAEKLAEWAKGLSGFSDVKPDPNGTDVQKLLSGIAERSKNDEFLYSKFFAIGLFRLLELTGAKDPQALGNLVKSMNLRQDLVNRDLLFYKGILSKLSAAKELMKEILARDRKKAAEREAEKKAKAEASQSKNEPEKKQTAVASESPSA